MTLIVLEREGEASTFADVPSSHPYHDPIEVLYQEGYTAGCSTSPLMYCPENTMSRAESAVFVERGIHGAEHTPLQPTEQIFADVPLWEWYAKWSTALWEDGYTGGCGTDPVFYWPLEGHTRAEACVFYLRMMYGAEYEPPAPQGYFADVVVFNPDNVIDVAVWENPHQYPKGIEYVIVNGQTVIKEGEHTGKLPGTILKKETV